MRLVPEIHVPQPTSLADRILKDAESKAAAEVGAENVKNMGDKVVRRLKPLLFKTIKV